jgi:hypothetical protein
LQIGRPAQLCPAREPIHVRLPEGPVFLGSAKIWLPAADGTITLAAPDLILHYMSAHRYLPPESFPACDKDREPRADWNAKREAERRLEAAFAKYTSRERVAAERRLACTGVDE